MLIIGGGSGGGFLCYTETTRLSCDVFSYDKYIFDRSSLAKWLKFEAGCGLILADEPTRGRQQPVEQDQ